MIPTFALPGERQPGQFGPISVVPFGRAWLYTRSMSCAGIPSVMHMTVSMPASIASKVASAAKRAGTKTIAVFAPASATASRTVSKTGMPSTSSPPLPGVTPATTFVP